MSVNSNSSLLGFKGTEDLGNGLKALFQAETTVYLNGGNSSVNPNTGSMFGTSTGTMRDSFVGLSSKYGTVMGGYISTPFRSSLASFDVMPGATGSSEITAFVGGMRFGARGDGDQGTGALAYSSAIRSSAIAYAMPTLYGFDASIAYTGSNNNGSTNGTAATGNCGDLSACTITPQSAWGFNLGWTGYGLNIKGAFQQANNNTLNPAATVAASATGGAPTSVTYTGANTLGDYTSYLVGAIYTGLPNLKASVVYNRNSLGTNGDSVVGNGANKISNNVLWAGASYRMGNWEPRIQATWIGDTDGAQVQQNGARMWTANVGYYLSKRTQVYGLISNLNNSANQNYSFAQQANSMKATGGQNLFTYGMGVRTTF